MTAKHRRGKSSNKHEENSYKHDSLEPEERPGNNLALLLVLFLIIVIGGATVGWFCFQQQQTLTYLTDNLMGMQMKMVKLQSFQEELRKSTEKHGMEGFEQRLVSLEESYSLAQKQVGMALATAEQLKTSDLPAQVLALHSEMKVRLAEMQQATVSSDQLAQLTATLSEQNQEFEAVKQQVQGLAGVSAELAQNVENLSGSLSASEAMVDDRTASIGALGAQLEDQAAKLQGLNDLLAAQQAELETSTQDIAGVKALLEAEGVQRSQQANVEEQLGVMRTGLQEQSKAAQDLHSELLVQLQAIQSQLENGGVPVAAPAEEAPVAAAEVAEAVEEATEDNVAIEAAEASAGEEEVAQEVEQEAVEEAAAPEQEEVEEEEPAPAAATTEEVEETSEDMAASEPEAQAVEAEPPAEDTSAEE
ncbi:retinitis pigmentosa 1-like 1 protein isoform X2 [Sardina pilchardus]|uniref:retinitis pigmentosa 1-like 1 protein isoform X2 n=1 Tax=Sardina pilchardus TaxID=27697 RepID=UPI002E12C28E